jgi:hypothetical protein
MQQVVEQTDLLRALGRSLDEQKAYGIKIAVHETFLSVEWGPGGGARTQAYQEHHLEHLRKQARAMRSGESGNASTPGALCELLRTLGQELDQAKVEANGIVQEAEGFRVSGVQKGKYFTQLYRTRELQHLSRLRREARGKGPAGAAVAAPEPFDTVTIGLPVYSQDSELLGTVSEIAGRAFKVMDPTADFGFWLRSSDVATVSPDQWAQLSFPRHQLDRHRSFTMPE